MGPNKTVDLYEEASTVIYPIQLVQIGKLQNVPAPLVRVSTCGGLQLEVLREVMSTDPTHGRYQVVTLHNRPKGSSTGLTFLKILASLPGALRLQRLAHRAPTTYQKHCRRPGRR